MWEVICTERKINTLWLRVRRVCQAKLRWNLFWALDCLRRLVRHYLMSAGADSTPNLIASSWEMTCDPESRSARHGYVGPLGQSQVTHMVVQIGWLRMRLFELMNYAACASIESCYILCPFTHVVFWNVRQFCSRWLPWVHTIHFLPGELVDKWKPVDFCSVTWLVACRSKCSSICFRDLGIPEDDQKLVRISVILRSMPLKYVELFEIHMETGFQLFQVASLFGVLPSWMWSCSWLALLVGCFQMWPVRSISILIAFFWSNGCPSPKFMCCGAISWGGYSAPSRRSTPCGSVMVGSAKRIYNGISI